LLLSFVVHDPHETSFSLHFLVNQTYYFVSLIVQPSSTSSNREHWTGEVSADKWVPILPAFYWPLVFWKKYFVFIKTTYSSRYSFIACNSRYDKYSLHQTVTLIYLLISVTLSFPFLLQKMLCLTLFVNILFLYKNICFSAFYHQY